MKLKGTFLLCIITFGLGFYKLCDHPDYSIQINEVDSITVVKIYMSIDDAAAKCAF